MKKIDKKKIIDDISKIVKCGIDYKHGVEDILESLKKDTYYKKYNDNQIRNIIRDDFFIKPPKNFIRVIDENKNYVLYKEPIDLETLNDLNNLKNEWFKIYCHYIFDDMSQEAAVDKLMDFIYSNNEQIETYGLNTIGKTIISLFDDIEDTDLFKKRFNESKFYYEMSHLEKDKALINSGTYSYLETISKEEQNDWVFLIVKNISEKMESISTYIKNINKPFVEQNKIFISRSLMFLLPIFLICLIFFKKVDIFDSYVPLSYFFVCFYFLLYYLKGQFLLRLLSLFSLYQLLKNIPLFNFISVFDENVSSSYLIPDFNVFFVSFFLSHILLSPTMFYLTYIYYLLWEQLYKVFIIKFYLYFKKKRELWGVFSKIGRIETNFLIAQYTKLKKLDSQKEAKLKKFSKWWTLFISKVFNINIEKNIDEMVDTENTIINYGVYIIVSLLFSLFFNSFIYKDLKGAVISNYLIPNNHYCKGIDEHQLIIKMNDGAILIPLSNIVDKEIKIPEKYKEHKYMSYPCEHITLIK